jgi:hypothetical protein
LCEFRRPHHVFNNQGVLRMPRMEAVQRAELQLLASAQ